MSSQIYKCYIITGSCPFLHSTQLMRGFPVLERETQLARKARNYCIVTVYESKLTKLATARVRYQMQKIIHSIYSANHSKTITLARGTNRTEKMILTGAGIYLVDGCDCWLGSLSVSALSYKYSNLKIMVDHKRFNSYAACRPTFSWQPSTSSCWSPTSLMGQCKQHYWLVSTQSIVYISSTFPHFWTPTG